MTTTTEFIHRIREDLHGGYRFIPFLGAGLSKPSGVPTTPELKRYLAFCIVKALGLDPFALPGTAVPADEPWHPRRHLWPSLIAPKQRANREVTAAGMDSILTAALQKFPGHPGKLDLIREGHGSLADWRTALLFLSRLTVRQEKDGTNRVMLGSPDSSVIDSFFRFLLKDRQPCLGHRMIHALSSLLRYNLILTTNFDDLVERAFATAGAPLTQFEVPLGASLPSPRLVLGHRSIVKLHGGQFGLRADYSLDSVPGRTDRWNFLAYLAGRSLENNSEIPPETSMAPMSDRVSLLMFGLSARDQRTQSLLGLSLQKFPNLRIYWVCFSKSDADFASEFAQENDAMGRIHRLRHSDLGQLMLQIYQDCSCSVPTSGIIFPALWNLPTPPLLPIPGKETEERKSFERLREAIKNRVANWTRKSRTRGKGGLVNSTDPKPIVVLADHEVRGAVTVCSDLFFESDWGPDVRPVECLWIDLDDIAEPVGLFLRLTLMMARQHGDMNPISSLDLSAFYDPERFSEFENAVLTSLRSYAARTESRWIVFINAYEGAGANARFEPIHNWRRQLHVQPLVNLIPKIVQDAGCRMNFVLILQSGRRPSILQRLCLEDERWPDPAKEVLALSRPASQFRHPIAVENAFKYFISRTDDPATSGLKLKFLYLVSLFGIARYPASLVRIFHKYCEEIGVRSIDDPGCEYSSVGRDPISRFQVKINEWISTLEEFGVIRRKVGDLIWLHLRLRDDLRKRLRRDYRISREDAHHLSNLTARWYGRLLLATADPLAAIESLHHCLDGIATWFDTREWKEELSEEKDRATLEVNAAERSAVMAAHSLLVINTAETLLKRRLSDQFADSALAALQSRVKWTIDKLRQHARHSKARRQLWKPTEQALIRLLRRVVLLRSSLYSLEGEYLRVLELKQGRLGPSGQPLYRLLKAYQRPVDYENQIDQHRLELDVANAHLCLRHYEKAEEGMKRLWTIDYHLVWPQLKNRPQEWQTAAAAARRHLHLLTSGGPPEVLEKQRRFITRIARRLVYLRLHQSLAAYLGIDPTDRQRPELNAERRQERIRYLTEALWFAEFGLEVLRGISDTQDDYVFEENVRIRAHAALCHGALSTVVESNGDGGVSTLLAADMALSDAESFIDEFPMKDPGISRAILELRRAELNLIRVGNVRWFRLLRGTVRQWYQSLEKFESANDLAHLEVPTGHDTKDADVYSVLSEIYEALRAIDRAQSELRNHPKSRWWWWILGVLKTKAGEYLYTVRLARHWLERTSPVASDQNRLANGKLVPAYLAQFFREEIRDFVAIQAMNDIFQLTRLLDAYGNVVLLIAVFQIHNQHSPKAISNQLEGGVDRLKAIRIRLEHCLKIDPDVDVHVRNYAHRCLEQAQRLQSFHDRISGSSRQPIRPHKVPRP